jgi:hypothetical protein
LPAVRSTAAAAFFSKTLVPIRCDAIRRSDCMDEFEVLWQLDGNLLRSTLDSTRFALPI